MTDRNELERLQPMTAEEKALALVNAERARTGYDPCNFWSKAVSTQLYSALLTAIEVHEADKKAFSDAAVKAAELIKDWVGSTQEDGIKAASFLSPYLPPEPEPDPLTEALKADGWRGNRPVRDMAESIRQALAARGYKIERIEQ